VKHQLKPNRASCFPTSLAMALNVPVDRVIQFCGHDGMEIVQPASEVPFCYRGFHDQEMQAFAMSMGHCLVLFTNETLKFNSPDGSIREEQNNFQIPWPHPKYRIIGCTDRHAVAIERDGSIFDPDCVIPRRHYSFLGGFLVIPIGIAG